MSNASESRRDASPPPQTSPARGLKGPSAWMVAVVAGLVVTALVAGAIWGEQLRGAGGWALGLVGDGHDHAEDVGQGAATRYYTCGMHPWVVLPEPGPCPICAMDLIPLDPAKFSGEVVIDPVVVQNMGVRIGEVTTGPLVQTIRTVGNIDYDETRVRDVNTKIGGWIEELYVDALGTEVGADDPLFSVYSPELYAAQEEYLSAYRNRGGVGGENLLEAAATRLSYYDVGEAQVRELEERGTPTKAVVIRSPHTGVVIEKHANEGMMIDPGMRVYRIADLSRLWVMVTVYEYQLPYVQVGQKATMTLPYIPGQTFEGEVKYIYPYLNTRSREARVRLEVANPHGLLKPGMFANVELRNTLARDRVLVPRSAVIDTGERQVAFVSLGEGRFEPRDLRLGVETEAGQVEVLEGLEPGEKVVTSGQFLLDSESKVREALAKMIRGETAADQQPHVAAADDAQTVELPEPAAASLATALESYFTLGEALANDRVDGLAEPARRVAEALERLTSVEVPAAPHFWHRHDTPGKARAAALELAETGSLEDARLAFADLSVAMEGLLRATGVPPQVDQQVQALRCPMYLSNQGGARWLQAAGEVRNPFMGQMMLGCFDERVTLPVTGSGGGPADGPPEPHAH